MKHKETEIIIQRKRKISNFFIAVALACMLGDILYTGNIFNHVKLLMIVSLASFAIAVLLDIQIKNIKRKQQSNE